ncbi:MAG: hypothetical protein M3N32_08420, partial [Actinomycetota bacterium]|nr:hypothetical protein [Actinomycetota bacterium]
PEPVLLAPHLAYSELWEMQQQGKLPTGEDVSRDWELLALTILKVSTSRTPLLPLGPQGGGPVAMGTGLGLQSQVQGGLGPIAADPGCLRFEPKAEPSEIVLRVPVPVALPLHTTADSVGVFLRDEDDTTSRIGFLVRLFHTSTYLNLHLYEREVVLTLPADAVVTLCGLWGR